MLHFRTHRGLIGKTLVYFGQRPVEQRGQLQVGVGFHLGRQLRLSTGQTEQILLQEFVDRFGYGGFFGRLLFGCLCFLPLLGFSLLGLPFRPAAVSANFRC